MIDAFSCIGGFIMGGLFVFLVPVVVAIYFARGR